MRQTTYELLALLDRTLHESVGLLKRLTTCPGQRSDVLIPLLNEIEYLRAQAGFEVTTEASDFEQTQATRWSRMHRRHETWLKDPDDVFLEAEDRDKQRKKQGLRPRIIVLPWSAEEEDKLVAAKARKKGRSNRPGVRPKATAKRRNT
jgi:hypothetical protein